MSAITIAMAIGLGGVLAYLSSRAQDTLEEIGSHLRMEAFFDPAMSSADVAVLLKSEVSKINGVKSPAEISKEQAIKEYKRATGEDAEAVLGFNPLPASIRIQLATPRSMDAARISAALKHIRGVLEVHFDAQALCALEDRAEGLRMLTMLIGGLLLIAALTFIHTTTRLAIQARRETLRTMILLGASRSTIQLPFVLEGATSGFLGGILGCALFLIIGRLMLPQISPELGIPHLTSGNGSILALIQLGVGLLLGIFVSYFSVLTWSVRKS